MVGIPSVARALLGSPRYSTSVVTTATSNQFQKVVKTATQGELFCDQILSCIDTEATEEELGALMLSCYAPPTATDMNTAHALPMTLAPTTTVVPSRFAKN